MTEKDEIISEQKELLEKTNSIIEAHVTTNDDLKNEKEKNVEYSIDLGHSKSDVFMIIYTKIYDRVSKCQKCFMVFAGTP